MGADGGKWLDCNGQTVNSNLYPKLAALMINVPDYRGMFLRGYGSNVYSDQYGNINHSSSTLGSIQSDTIRNITGWFIAQASDFDDSNNADQRLFKTIGDYNSRRKIGGDDAWNKVIYFDTSKIVPTSDETRPINIAVHYIIKAK